MIHPDAITIIFVIGSLVAFVSSICIGCYICDAHREKKEREHQLKLRELDWLRNQDGEE